MTDTHRTIDRVWRSEAAKVIGGLARIVRDVSLAEELAQDALLAALEQWPRDGIPTNPGAWLMATAKHRAIDRIRHRQLAARKHEQLVHELEADQCLADSSIEAEMDDLVGDDLLRLMFVACHPVLSMEAQTALTLRLLGGLRTDEIARAFLVPEPTIAQRIVRAKRTLSASRVPFEVPAPHEIDARLGSVLAVIYLIFNEGYAATAGDDWTRPGLCDEALRLARILASLAPSNGEVLGLLSLMELQASRLRSRTRESGEPIPLSEQDRSTWDHELIASGLKNLRRVLDLGESLGPYALQASIASYHARAGSAGDTDWAGIAALYDALAQLSPSPVIELNRAVALSMAFGPEAGLEIVDPLRDEPSLAQYPLLPAVRGDLLAKLGRHTEAKLEFERAASLTRNSREQAHLLARAADCGN